MDTVKKKYLGGCHCKKVLFEFISLVNVKLIKCNCTICKPLRYLHLIISHEDFKLVSNIKIFKAISLEQKKPNIFFVGSVELKVFTNLDLIRMHIALIIIV